MDKLNKLREKVDELYNSRLESRDDWCDWLYENHVLLVAGFAKELAERYGADPGLAQAAALLHDIADYKMARSNPDHETESLKIAAGLMKEAGYLEDETKRVVDDAIKFHSCKDEMRPKSKEGLVLAAADSMAHLKTDFYLYALWMMAKKQSLADSKAWTLEKIERDFGSKINFPDLREELRPDYEAIKRLFGR